jgi:CDP-glycerol glycerophosphotransferase (TagB/SpsB family)
MILPKLVGKGLFVFSDPGGAKPCLSYILINNCSNYIVISDREYKFYSDFKINVIITEEVERYIFEFKPDYIFSATSYTSNIEKIAIKNAKINKIPTITYIDHSTNILDRFILNNELHLPDFILVSDYDTQNELQKLNLVNSCNITQIENPFHVFLANWKPKIDKESFLFNLNIPTKKKIILLAFDPLSNINGLQKYGVDELSAIKEINPIIESKDLDYTFIFKPHPNQNLDLLKNVLSDKIILVSSQSDTNILIYFSDIIIGFFSNILLEASVFDKKIIRYHPNGFKNDPFLNKKIGIIATKETLIKYL